MRINLTSANNVGTGKLTDPWRKIQNDKQMIFSINKNFILALVFALFLYGCVGNRKDKSETPNIVLIYTDDLGYGDLSCYGATKVTTPNIDRLAQEGRSFTDAHSVSAVCTPSRYALLTGQYPFKEDIYAAVFHKVGLIVDTARFTVADLMKKHGYATACIGKWHLGFGDSIPDWNGELNPGPLELGFDYYFGMPVVSSHPPFVYVENHRVVGLDPNDPFVFDQNQKAETREFQEKMWIDRVSGARAAHALYNDELVGTTLAEKAVQWIRDQKKNPFFLYLATTNIHHPYTPHPRFQGTSQAGRYGDFIHELDWIVGEVMNTLEEQGLAENTLVIFTSDNGGMLNQGGQDAWKLGHRMNGDLFGFKFDAWEGGHRIPFIVRWPGKIEPGSRSDILISNVDMLATFADLLDYDLSEGEGPDSYSVLPALTGNPEKQIRDHLGIAAWQKPNLSLRSGKWMYIGAQGGGGFTGTIPGDHGLGGPGALNFTGGVNSDIVNGKIREDAPKEQLYNLENDLGQSRNVILDYPEIAMEMRQKLNWLITVEQTRPGAEAVSRNE